MKLKLWINTGYSGCDYEDEIDVSDDYTEEQCEEEAKIFLFNHIEYGWEKTEG